MRFPSLPSLLVVGAGTLVAFLVLAGAVLAFGGSTGVDDAVYGFVQSHRSDAGTRLADVVTALGSYQFVIVLTLLFGVITWTQTRRFAEPLVLLVSTPLASGLVLTIKLAAGRHRPPSAALLGEAPTDFSFPSGHTTSGSVLFVLAAILIASRLSRRWARRTIRGAGIAIAVLIGGSRVYLGYHWTTDVIGGWLLATTVVCGCMATVVVVDELRPALASEPVSATVKPTSP